MRIRTKIPLTALVLQALTLLIANNPSAAEAETIWSGPNTNFTQTGTATSDVLIPAAIAIERRIGSYLYNPIVDTSGPGEGTPSGTEWAFGTMANHVSLTYEPFSQIRTDGQNLGLHVDQYIVNKSMVMHLINQDIYISVMFTSWAEHGAGTFAYTRSTPAAAPPPKPSVSITNPASGSVFSDPANVKIAAGATVSSGSVTNVLFFRDTTLIGSKQAVPFTITNSFTSGTYALTAVATAAGISATSAPVSISVVSPVTTSLSTPVTTPGNQFAFGYSSTPGLRYEIDVSSNLFDWTPLSTNVATGNPSFFTNPISGDGNYYRVGRLPNP